MNKVGLPAMAAIVAISFCSIAAPHPCAAAGEGSFTQKDRELLIRLDERLNQIDKRFEQIEKRFEQIDKRFEQVDKRFEQVDKRFAELREDMNKRFEQVDKRFESLIQMMMAIVGAFAAIVAATIGFALWDRRTMTRPFEEKVKEMDSEITRNRDAMLKLLSALRELAKKDEKLAAVLRNFSLL